MCGYVHVSKVPIDPIVILLTPALGTELRSPSRALVIFPHRVLASSGVVRAWSLTSHQDPPGSSSDRSARDSDAVCPRGGQK